LHLFDRNRCGVATSASLLGLCHCRSSAVIVLHSHNMGWHVLFLRLFDDAGMLGRSGVRWLRCSCCSIACCIPTCRSNTVGGGSNACSLVMLMYCMACCTTVALSAAGTAGCSPRARPCKLAEGAMTLLACVAAGESPSWMMCRG
jgi:hypothetical protein